MATFSIVDIKITKNTKLSLKFIFLFFLTVFIGLRHEVGGDWDIYLYDFYNNVEHFDILKLDYVRDFGYELISYFSFKLNIGIYGLNFILATIFVFAINKFSLELKNNYWLIILISFPYLIVIVAMGYTRQAAAFSFVLLSICNINERKLILFLLNSLLAILFHKSSAIMLPIIFISFFRFNLKNLFIFSLLFITSMLIIYPEIDRISSGYLNQFSQYKSSGVVYRISLNILAGLIFVIFYKKLKFDSSFNKLLIIVFFINCFLFFLIDNYSTFVDRIIIYFTFIQLVVFSRLYLILPKYKIIINILVIIMYGFVFNIWMNLSFHSYAWIPYKNILLINL